MYFVELCHWEAATTAKYTDYWKNRVHCSVYIKKEPTYLVRALYRKAPCTHLGSHYLGYSCIL